MFRDGLGDDGGCPPIPPTRDLLRQRHPPNCTAAVAAGPGRGTTLASMQDFRA